MQKHREVLADLEARLSRLAEEAEAIKQALRDELSRIDTFIAAGGEAAPPPSMCRPWGGTSSVTVSEEAGGERPFAVTPPLQDFEAPIAPSIEDFVPVHAASDDHSVPEEHPVSDSSRDLFEPILDFRLSSSISLADTFFYAGELFMGNKPLFEEMLTEMEQLSSMTQVENYLYQVRGFSKDDPVVQRLLGFVVSHASSRK